MSRHFTLWEAQDLLHEVAEDLRRAVELKTELDKVGEEMQGEARRVMLSGGALVNRTRAAQVRARQEALASRLQNDIEGIHAKGCLVKDLDSGLLDFPTYYQGREVCLCWKLGEDVIQYWHEVEDGYRGRRLIDSEFLENHRGDPAH